MMITSTSLGFELIVTRCDNVLRCNSLELIDQPMLEITNHAHAFDHRKSIRSAASTFGFEQLLRQTVCVIRYHVDVDEDCRTCLREASDCKSFGEFLFTNKGILYSATILHTSHSKDTINQACKAFDACGRMIKSKFLDQTCHEIHYAKASEFYRLSSLREDQRENELKSGAERQERELKKRFNKSAVLCQGYNRVASTSFTT